MPTLTDEQLFDRLIAMPTVSKDSNLDFIDFLSEYGEESGARVERDANDLGTKENLILRWGPDEAGGLLLSGHTDVVPVDDQHWSKDPFTLQPGKTPKGQEALFGRGTSDMKAFIAHSMNAVRRVDLASLRKPLTAIWTYDEELGCLGAAKLVERYVAAKRPLPEMALVGEPTSFGVLIAHKGHTRFDIEVRGIGGHSSQPDAGCSAIEWMAHIVIAVKELFQDERNRPRHRDLFPYYPFPTVNFGMIQGGQAINMIPESCTLSIGYRTLPGDDPLGMFHRVQEMIDERILPKMQKGHPQASVRCVPGEGVAAMRTPEQTPLGKILADLLDSEDVGAAPFTTEGSTFSEVGVSCLICGPGSIDQAHQPDEFITREDFDRGGPFVEQVLRRACLP